MPPKFWNAHNPHRICTVIPFHCPHFQVSLFLLKTFWWLMALAIANSNPCWLTPSQSSFVHLHLSNNPPNPSTSKPIIFIRIFLDFLSLLQAMELDWRSDVRIILCFSLLLSTTPIFFRCFPFDLWKTTLQQCIIPSHSPSLRKIKLFFICYWKWS